jgi:hypothetical protein
VGCWKSCLWGLKTRRWQRYRWDSMKIVPDGRDWVVTCVHHCVVFISISSWLVGKMRTEGRP